MNKSNGNIVFFLHLHYQNFKDYSAKVLSFLLSPSSGQAQARLEAELALFSFNHYNRLRVHYNKLRVHYNRLWLHYNRLQLHYTHDSLFDSFYAPRWRQTSKLGILGILQLVTC